MMPGVRRGKQKYERSDLSAMLTEGLERASTRPTVHNYIPHDKQVLFHSSKSKGRLYIGGNRSGKTVGGIVEDVFRLRGKHPYQQVPPGPIHGRIVTVSYTEGILKIILPELAKWLPPSDLINGSWEDSYSKSERTLKLVNGSSVELMSQDQQLVKFAGTARDFIHFDEEPPKDIFNECKMRLIDRAGCWYITMTPVEGMTWVYDDVYEPGLVPGSNITVITIDTEENPYISSAEVDLVIEGLDDNEKRARKKGEFVQIGGLAFKQFTPHHVRKFTIPPLEWTHYMSLDHGLNNPTCWLWHAVAPSGAVVTYDELYANETLIHTFAEEIHKRNKLPGRRAPNIYVGDPSIAQRNAQTGDSIQTSYSMAGIPIVLGNNNVPIGVEKMNRYLQQGKWIISEDNCPMLIREMQRLRWKVYENAKKRRDNNVREELHKKDDHAPDSARYLFSFMPDLYIPNPDAKVNPEVINKLIQDILSSARVPVGPAMYDQNLSRSLGAFHPDNVNTEWYYVDEHMGGEF